jgi:hypothetical protein
VTTRDDLERWGKASLAFLARFADRFAQRESREQAAKSLRGLVAPVERTHGWQVAEAEGDVTPNRVQRQDCGTAGKVKSGQIGDGLAHPLQHHWLTGMILGHQAQRGPWRRPRSWV